jgi:hypothetical protein
MGLFDTLKDAALRAEYERLKMLDKSDQVSDDTAMQIASYNAKSQGKEVTEKDILEAKQMLNMSESAGGGIFSRLRLTNNAKYSALSSMVQASDDLNALAFKLRKALGSTEKYSQPKMPRIPERILNKLEPQSNITLGESLRYSPRGLNPERGGE